MTRTPFMALALVAALAYASAACATSKPPPSPPPATPPAASTSSSTLTNSTDVQAQAGAIGYGAGYSQSISSPSVDGSTRSYSLVSSGTATPLPPGLCPKGDSFYLQVLGGLLFTYATSASRTEMECLDKVLAVVRQDRPPVEQRLILMPGEPIHPPAAKPAPRKPAAKPAARKPAPPTGLCADGGTPACQRPRT